MSVNVFDDLFSRLEKEDLLGAFYRIGNIYIDVSIGEMVVYTIRHYRQENTFVLTARFGVIHFEEQTSADSVRINREVNSVEEIICLLKAGLKVTDHNHTLDDWKAIKKYGHNTDSKSNQ